MLDWYINMLQHLPLLTKGYKHGSYLILPHWVNPTVGRGWSWNMERMDMRKGKGRLETRDIKKTGVGKADEEWSIIYYSSIPRKRVYPTFVHWVEPPSFTCSTSIRLCIWISVRLVVVTVSIRMLVVLAWPASVQRRRLNRGGHVEKSDSNSLHPS